jgi:signal transduction histidine kinase
VVASGEGRAAGRSPVEEDPRLVALCRLVFDFRVVALTITFVSLLGSDNEMQVVLPGLLLAVVMSVVPLLLWHRLGAFVSRHPLFLAVDLLVSMGILSVIGAGSPFYYYTIGTALLSGVVYGWTGALVFSPFLVVAYLSGLSPQDWIESDLDPFQVLVGLPILYPLAAAAGAAVRRLVDRLISTEQELRDAAWSTAADRERSRIAREMHDSLAKTLHGIALAASALPRWVEKNPDRAAGEARALATAAETAATEGRQLIYDLRADELDSNIGEAFERYVYRWAERHGIDASFSRHLRDPVPPSVRWELFQILKESLTNIERHAHASSVWVLLRQSDTELTMAIEDNGRGCGPELPDRRGREGHFGLVGMKERAARLGGSLEFASQEGEGVTVLVRIPLGAATISQIALEEKWQPVR